MKEYIKYDIHSGRVYLKCAIMNVLRELVDGYETEYTFGCDMPLDLVLDCCREYGFMFDNLQDGIHTFRSKKQTIVIYPRPTAFIIRDENYQGVY